MDEKLSKTTLISSREIVGRPLVEFPSHSNICENLKQLVMGTESNAFMISKKTAATWWVVERFSYQSLVMDRRASCVDDLCLKSYWQSDRRFFLCRKYITLLWIHLSSTVKIRERKEMGR